MPHPGVQGPWRENRQDRPHPCRAGTKCGGPLRCGEMCIDADSQVRDRPQNAVENGNKCVTLPSTPQSLAQWVYVGMLWTTPAFR